ncbi:cell division protein FtsA C-terminal domain-containing protein, partial [Streptococcus pyogenes]
SKSEPKAEEEVQVETPIYTDKREEEEPKTNIGDRLRGFFGSMFE